MIEIIRNLFEAPKVAEKIEKVVNELDKPDDYALSLQLSYRDNNTIFYLDKVESINFSKDYLMIKQKNNTHSFFYYENILEYGVINTEDIINLGVI